MGFGFCGQCGTPRDRPDQAFCTSCGQALTPTPSAAVAVPFDVPSEAPSEAPTVTVPRAAAPLAPEPVPAPVPAAPAEVTDYAVMPLAPSNPPRMGRILGIGALVLALVLGGVVVWQVFFGRGGASSPEDAAQDFLDAMARQDGVALMSAVVPGEVEGLDEVYRAAHDRLEDEGYIDGDGLTDAITLEFSDLEFERDDVGDDVALVGLKHGSATVSWDPSKLTGELADLLKADIGKQSETFDLADVLSDEFASPFTLLTVKSGGGWYVSLLGTAAEAVFQDYDAYEGLRDPEYDAVTEDVDPITGETPEDVVENLLDAVNDGDASALLANLPEDLGLGLRPYASVVEDVLRDYDAGVEFSADEVDLDSEELGDGRIRVDIDELAGSGYASTVDGSVNGSLSLYGQMCFRVEDYDYGETESDCADEDLLDDLGLDSFYVIMSEVDGGYQLDPVATLVDVASTVVEEMPSALIDDIVEEIVAEACYEASGEYDRCYGYDDGY